MLLGCPHTDAPIAASVTTASAPVPPAPPPLPPLPPSALDCPAAPLHAWSRLEGPIRVAGTLTFPERGNGGGLYEILPVEPMGEGEWIEVTTAQLDHARAAPEGMPPAFALRRADLELAPSARLVLGEETRLPGSGEPRVELGAGARLRVLEARDGRLHVATVGGRFAAEGWVDAAGMSGAWRPCPYRAPPPNRSVVASAAPVGVRSSPDGPVLAWLSGEASVLAVASDAPTGWVRVVAVSPAVWVDGYVPSAALAEFGR